MKWVVTIEADGSSTDAKLDELMDLLVDYDGVVSGGSGSKGISVTLTVDAESGPTAGNKAWDVVGDMAFKAGASLGKLTALEVITTKEQDRRLAVSNFPDIVGTTEVCQHLGISRQRLHQLRGGNFPRPMVTLAATPVWLRSAIDSFAERWNRKPGRPAKAG